MMRTTYQALSALYPRYLVTKSEEGTWSMDGRFLSRLREARRSCEALAWFLATALSSTFSLARLPTNSALASEKLAARDPGGSKAQTADQAEQMIASSFYEECKEAKVLRKELLQMNRRMIDLTSKAKGY